MSLFYLWWWNDRIRRNRQLASEDEQPPQDLAPPNENWGKGPMSREERIWAAIGILILGVFVYLGIADLA